MKLAKGASGVAGQVEQLVRPAIEQLGLRLWDVRFEKEGSLWLLRIFIDRDEPLDTDTCEAASRTVDPILDEADPISQSYVLEVGSPGLGRRLTRTEHFEAMLGQKLRAKLYGPDEAGRREVAGVLAAFDGTQATLDGEDGRVVLPLDKAAGFWLCDDENLF